MVKFRWVPFTAMALVAFIFHMAPLQAKDELKLTSLAVPKDAGVKIAPRRGPASVDTSHPSVISSHRGVIPYMSVTCKDRTGRFHYPGESRYPDCLESTDFDQKSTSLPSSSQNTYKYLQMGIIIK